MFGNQTKPASPDAMMNSGMEILPGTEIMTDVDGAQFVHANGSRVTAVLVPQPSSDPNDPLVSS